MGMPTASGEALVTRHAAHCPHYIKHFKGPVNLINILLGKKIPEERENSSTTKYLKATKDFGINPQLIHKDNPGHSPDFFYYLPDQQPGKQLFCNSSTQGRDLIFH